MADLAGSILVTSNGVERTNDDSSVC